MNPSKPKSIQSWPPPAPVGLLFNRQYVAGGRVWK